MSPPQKKAKKSNWAKVPRDVLLAAQGAAREDGRVEELPEEGLWLIECVLDDAVYGVINGWVSGLDADPYLMAGFSPPPNILNTVLCPPNAIGIDILREAVSVAYHYAPLTRESFEGGMNVEPPIPAPLAVMPMLVNVHHAKIALNALLHRIQSLNDPNYPTISNLASGSYICNMVISWANAGQSVSLFKT
jgi:hypothetical protein